MKKSKALDDIVKRNKGYLKASDANEAGVSRAYFGEYIRSREFERVAQGLYLLSDAWMDSMYVIQSRYPQAIFSHESALYLLDLAEREPIQYSVTLKAGSNASRLKNDGVKVYKVKDELFEMGITQALSPAGHELRVYNPERTICDLVRNRSQIEIQTMLTAIRSYLFGREKNIPQLMRYAEKLSVEKKVREYVGVLLG